MPTRAETHRATTKLIREGRWLAEVDIELIGDDEWSPDTSPWAPYISANDVRKLDEVRLALRRGDLKAAALGRVYELKPVAAAQVISDRPVGSRPSMRGIAAR